MKKRGHKSESANLFIAELMGSLKDRNVMDLTEADNIKKRWQEYKEECTKKIFTT